MIENLDYVMSKFDTRKRYEKQYDETMDFLGLVLEYCARRNSNTFTELDMNKLGFPDNKKIVEDLLTLEAIFSKGRITSKGETVDSYVLSPTAEKVFESGYAFYPTQMIP